MTREGDLEAVRLKGKRIRTSQFEVRYVASPLRHPRAGIIVPLYGHTAVDRNVLKRRMRALARTDLLPALAPCDVVLRATPRAYGAGFEVLRQSLYEALKQLPRRVGNDPA